MDRWCVHPFQQHLSARLNPLQRYPPEMYELLPSNYHSEEPATKKSYGPNIGHSIDTRILNNNGEHHGTFSHHYNEHGESMGVSYLENRPDGLMQHSWDRGHGMWDAKTSTQFIPSSKPPSEAGETTGKAHAPSNLGHLALEGSEGRRPTDKTPSKDIVPAGARQGTKRRHPSTDEGSTDRPIKKPANREHV